MFELIYRFLLTDKCNIFKSPISTSNKTQKTIINAVILLIITKGDKKFVISIPDVDCVGSRPKIVLGILAGNAASVYKVLIGCGVKKKGRNQKYQA